MSNKEIVEFFGREIQILSKCEIENKLIQAFQYWRTKGFPYQNPGNVELENEFQRLKSTSSVIKKDNIGYSTVGLNLANCFHPHIWHVPSQGHSRSPVDHFNKDDTLKKILRRAIYLRSDRRCWSPYSVRSLFGIYAGGRIANFRPTVSKALISEFTSDNDIILDPCAGYGGRMLGAMSLKRHYIGIDASVYQYEGLSRMISALRKYSVGTTEVHFGALEELLPEMKSESVDMIFTSPPYYNLEKYCLSPIQSYIKYDSYEDWKNYFLKTLVSQATRLLKIQGHLLLNVANISKYNIADDVLSIAIKSLKLRRVINLPMKVRPGLNKKRENFRFEPVYVFQKH